MRFLVIVIDINSAIKSLVESQLFHVCKNTYLIDGPANEVMPFINSDLCEDYKECLFPECEWFQDYKYLGDISINENIYYDLRLKDNQYNHYELLSKLPEGLFFKNGILWGKSTQETGIVDIEVLALKGKYQSRYRKFQVRFFEGKNKAKSFTHNNYLSIGYGESMVDYDPSAIYYRILEESRAVVSTSPLEEAKRAAKEIEIAANGREIELYVSGGIDSQCMVQSFLLAEVQFTAILMIDENGSNAEDVFFCRKFFSERQINLKEFRVDYKKHIDSYEYLDLALTYRFNNPEYGLLLSLMSNKDAFPVYAGRPISISYGAGEDMGIGLAVDETWSRARYLERERRNGCPEFLIYTKELVESFLGDSYVKNFSKKKWYYRDKVEMLKVAGFDVTCAPPSKLTGFEKLGSQFKEDHFGHDLWLHHRGPLKKRFTNSKTRNVVPISDVGIGDWKNMIVKSYEDGFSHAYIQKNSIEDFH